MIVRRIGRAEPRWSSPFNDFERVRREMFRFLDAYPGEQEAQAGVFPAINVTQDRESYFVRAELPGVQPDALEVTAEQRTLTIAGKRRAPEEKGVSYHRSERMAISTGVSACPATSTVIGSTRASFMEC